MFIIKCTLNWFYLYKRKLRSIVLVPMEFGLCFCWGGGGARKVEKPKLPQTILASNTKLLIREWGYDRLYCFDINFQHQYIVIFNVV